MKRAVVTIAVEYDGSIPDEWIRFAAGDALVQMTEATYRDPDGDNEEEFFADRHSLDVQITDTDAGAGAHLTAEDRKHLADKRGIFAEGYTPEDVTDLFETIHGADLYCVWAYADDSGAAGDSEFVGRTADEHAWYRVSKELWDYLYGAPDAPETLPEGTPALSTDKYEHQDVDDWPYQYDRNAAAETR